MSVTTWEQCIARELESLQPPTNHKQCHRHSTNKCNNSCTTETTTIITPADRVPFHSAPHRSSRRNKPLYLEVTSTAAFCSRHKLRLLCRQRSNSVRLRHQCAHPQALVLRPYLELRPQNLPRTQCLPTWLLRRAPNKIVLLLVKVLLKVTGRSLAWMTDNKNSPEKYLTQLYNIYIYYTKLWPWIKSWINLPSHFWIFQLKSYLATKCIESTDQSSFNLW